MKNVKTLIFRIRSLLEYYFLASTKYNIQSPFFHQFIRIVFDTSKHYYFYADIENERKRRLKDNSYVRETDFGAGRSFDKKNTKILVKKIALKSLSSSYQCRMLSNLVLYLRPKNILELGTSLGISTLYISKASPSSTVFSLEGNPEISNLAKESFQTLGAGNIQTITGPFEETLTKLLEKTNTFDIVYLDGNHRKEATIEYFELLKNKLGHQSVVVVDDIRWSEDMFEAWEFLKNHEKVVASLELWKIGFLFFNPKLSKEHHTFIPYPWKPWKIGLFGK